MKLLVNSIVGVAALFAAADVMAAADDSSTRQIYLQRASDGRVTLTDRPVSDTKIERTWQLDKEDRGSARQRALDVKAEAQAVSERVQRSIDLRERLASSERASAGRLSAGYADSYDGLDDGEVLIAPYGFSRGGYRHRGFRQSPRSYGGAPRFTGSGPLGSR